MCSELPHFLARSNSSALSEADTQRVCEALSASLAAAGRSLQQSVLASPGVTAFYETMHGAQPQLSAAQQLQVLECLAAMHKAGCGECVRCCCVAGYVRGWMHRLWACSVD